MSRRPCEFVSPHRVLEETHSEDSTRDDTQALSVSNHSCEYDSQRNKGGEERERQPRKTYQNRAQAIQFKHLCTTTPKDAHLPIDRCVSVDGPPSRADLLARVIIEMAQSEQTHRATSILLRTDSERHTFGPIFTVAQSLFTHELRQMRRELIVALRAGMPVML